MFPIPNYDELNDKEITERPDGLSPVEIRTIGDEYEKRNKKNRQTLIERIERKLKAAS